MSGLQILFFLPLSAIDKPLVLLDSGVDLALLNMGFSLR